MEIIETEICNHTIGKPSDMTDEQCSALPVHLYQDETGPWAVSFWKPSEEEIARLVNGGCIGLHLRCMPGNHPVTSVGTYALEAV